MSRRSSSDMQSRGESKATPPFVYPAPGRVLDATGNLTHLRGKQRPRRGSQIALERKANKHRELTDQSPSSYEKEVGPGADPTEAEVSPAPCICKARGQGLQGKCHGPGDQLGPWRPPVPAPGSESAVSAQHSFRQAGLAQRRTARLGSSDQSRAPRTEARGRGRRQGAWREPGPAIGWGYGPGGKGGAAGRRRAPWASGQGQRLGPKGRGKKGFRALSQVAQRGEGAPEGGGEEGVCFLREL